jgi:hypothetical protein
VRRFLFLLLALTFVSLAVLGRPAAAQGGIEVSAQGVSNEFPDGVVFHVSATSDAEITEATLRYQVAPDGSRAYGVAECTGVTSVDCSFNLESESGSFLIPGAEITYFWELTDAAGNHLETDPIVYVYEDNRFSWQSMTEGNLTVWFYSADEDEVRNVLQVGLETLDRMGSLLGAKIDTPVKVFYYGSAQDMQEAIGVQADTPDRGVITLGEVVFSDTALVSADVSPLDILRHELTHVVMRKATEGALVEVPAWLEEGTAVYAQNNRLGGVESALEQAIARNEPFSVRALTSSSLGQMGANVSLFYGQSWSLVSFLIDEFEPDDFRQLFAELRGGATVDEALQRVYGFDQDGLDNAWRQSVGLPPREVPVPTEEPAQAAVPATSAPAEEGPQALPENGGGGGTPIAVVVIVVAVAVALAGALAAGGIVVARRLR